jgi:hypothetical protein
MKNILLQTTIAYEADNWSIDRFSILADLLSKIEDESGNKAFQVTVRNRENLPSGEDRILSKLDDTAFDQLWLFGVDAGGGLGTEDCEAIARFRQRGGAILTSRDHQDLGISFCTLGGIGDANHFHSRNPEPNPDRRAVDDRDTPSISWPNYHSGSNGDFQLVEAALPLHPIMRNPGNPSGRIEFLPAHPHEGAISVPQAAKQHSYAIAAGRSLTTWRPFSIAISFEGSGTGRAVVDSSFHHFADYNLDPRKGCPSFVTETCSYRILENEQAATDARMYAQNIALWLAQ